MPQLPRGCSWPCLDVWGHLGRRCPAVLCAKEEPRPQSSRPASSQIWSLFLSSCCMSGSGPGARVPRCLRHRWGPCAQTVTVWDGTVVGQCRMAKLKVGAGTEKTVGAVCLWAGCWKVIRCLWGWRWGELGVEKPENRLLPPFSTVSYLGFSAWVLLFDFPLKQQKIKISHLSLFAYFREMKLKKFFF